MLLVLKSSKDKPYHPLEFKEYFGNVKVTKIDGRGRGLVVTKDILPGDLLLANRALAIVHPEQGSQLSSSLLAKVKRFRLLKEAVANSVKNSEVFAKKVYNLHAGPKLGYLDSIAIEKLCQNDPIDLPRIEGICLVNGFESPKTINSTEGSLGVWHFASFLNHDCSQTNALWAIYNDFVFVRAAKSIPKGQEILISYIDPYKPYSIRRDMFLKHDFVCYCKLCTIEAKESKDVRKQREILLSNEDIDQDDPEKIKLYLEKLENLRLSNPELNPFTLQPLITLGLVHFERKEYEKACNAFQKAYAICETFIQLYSATIFLATAITRSYLKLQKHSEAATWVKKIRDCIIVQYGTEECYEILEFLQPNFIKDIEMTDINIKMAFA